MANCRARRGRWGKYVRGVWRAAFREPSIAIIVCAVTGISADAGIYGPPGHAAVMCARRDTPRRSALCVASASEAAGIAGVPGRAGYGKDTLMIPQIPKSGLSFVPTSSPPGTPKRAPQLFFRGPITGTISTKLAVSGQRLVDVAQVWPSVDQI